MATDNTLLDQEIYSHNHSNEDQGNDDSLISTASEDDVAFTEQTNDSVLESNFADLDLESSSATFDDNNSVGTAVGGGVGVGQTEEQQQYSFTGQGFNKLKERVNSKIVQVANYANDDYRLIQR
jgi:hypothetical protein